MPGPFRKVCSWWPAVLVVSLSLNVLAAGLWTRARLRKGPSPEAAFPAPRLAGAQVDPAWLEQHTALARLGREEPIRVLFLGDSLTARWGEAGRAAWDDLLAPLGAAAFGISGDSTRQVLWRLEHGELDGTAPRLIVLLIGTNNLSEGDTASATAAGVAEVVHTLRERLPAAQVLLLGLFPRAGYRDRIARVNPLIARLEDGRHVRFLEIGPALDDVQLMPDGLHLSPQGYRVWAERMTPTLHALLAESRR